MAATATTTLSLVLFLSLLSASTISETQAQAESIVHVTSKLPGNTDAMHIHCTSKDLVVIYRELRAGQSCSWTAEEKTPSYCTAGWTGKMATWPAFEPSRDAGHGKVLWLVKEDGFYLSRDGSRWVKEAVWN
ncbi:uncharacterized protein LOC115743286 [Rhodamnia argentea]|uniref:Uncharacterized protein LOC115743286 n=1 Tax=Rhodamnia argentea TaxID=178133 RepID=A0A8B8PGE0_9MYRT|nr:uncharacterized protein LOC115743286 [Rhodamnia argentea]